MATALTVLRRSLAGMVALLGLLGVPFGAGDAQPLSGAPSIGFLSAFPIDDQDSRIAAFRQGLQDLGYVDGQNIAIAYRSAEGKPERLPELAAELARLKVQVIVTSGPPAPQAARRATRTIPIVFTVVADPVADGLVASLHRPGGNLTGLTSMSPDLVGKQLELLKAIVPRLSSVAVLRNLHNRGHAIQLQHAKPAARSLGVALTVIEASSADALDDAFRRIAAKRVGGVVVLRDGLFLRYRTRIVELATKAGVPSVFGHREEAEAGGLISYGADSVGLFRRAAVYVAKILKGEKPTDLPVEQPMQFELFVNMKTAGALGLTVPRSLLVRANRVIE